MKKLIQLATLLLITAIVGLNSVRADDPPKPKIKPYTLDVCAVCDMKLSEMGKPYIFVFKDREIKVCDKSEEADFKKEPAKYLKKIEELEAKAKKKT